MEENHEDSGRGKIRHELVMWIYRPESQIYPVMYLKCDKQVTGADSSPLLCLHDIPPGVLHHCLESPAQLGHGPAGESPDEGHEEEISPMRTV